MFAKKNYAKTIPHSTQKSIFQRREALPVIELTPVELKISAVSGNISQREHQRIPPSLSCPVNKDGKYRGMNAKEVHLLAAGVGGAGESVKF